MRAWKQHGLRLASCALIGVLVGTVAGVIAPPSAAAVTGWDAAALAYTARVWWLLQPASAGEIQSWADREDEGRWALTLILTAAVGASFIAIFAMVSDKSSATILSLAAFTIACSWTLLHTAFAAHYAHSAFARGADKPDIDFPGDEPPRFIDFAYYAFTVGMTFQVSDTATQSSEMRRLTLVHGVISFVFNTVIIAFSVSIGSSFLSD
ncbi:DUF1345 domain-containing protein [Hansschlegelia beijingensis]|uniref:Putative membrane protein n=1 Tax=Hansschlegelia beijingensis TaxID=1133344 RepID=A0A7W6D2X7_9HYPH|nr:putative membrane protein [Hansschlegelia beijingensis]